ncbi:MAG TPA: di-heme oxidoredictase family protein, partial [Xanthobacteraceae bacterium]|nr:di-heme oxidoredictase family protein [Xanthobacteraceae bacterium]
MKKSYLLSLTSIAAMMLSVTTAQNALAQNVLSANRGTQGQNGQTGCCNNQSSGAVDPGVRGGPAGAGSPVGGLTAAQQSFFTAAQARFEVIETVPAGLGPGFNELSCGSCHISPAVGGSSPTTNPQVTDANTDGATNVIPSFITASGPIREARFVLNPDGTPDGGVHDLFSIQGRSDATGCVFAQPDFATQLAANNVIFRIPPPTFGDGLVEMVSDSNLQSAVAGQAQQNASLGISSQFNLSGNTGNITRFGWKAQNASMMMFAGEAYNVEEGVTNDLFPDKRNNPTPQCAPNPLPEDTVNTVDAINSESTVSDNNPDTINFALFMRLLAPPTPAVPLGASSTASSSTSSTTSAAASSSTSSTSTTTTSASTTVATASVLPTAAGASSSSTSTAAASSGSTSSVASAASVNAGLQAFMNVGCGGCHIMNQTTGSAALIDTTANSTVSNITINPFSDFAVHNMGTGLADQVSQGNANGNQFRSAPLWGIGQRVFFLHDGRTNNLLTAIQQHASSGSEANQVISAF